MQAKAEKKTYNCKCGKSFPQSAGLSRHKRTCPSHSDNTAPQQEYICSKCKKSFTRKDNRDAHFKNCTNSRTKEVPPCSYPDCGKQFTTNYKLKRHISQVHDKEKENQTPKKKVARNPPAKKLDRINVTSLTGKHCEESSSNTLEEDTEFIEEVGRLFAGLVECELIDKEEFLGMDDDWFKSADVTQIIDYDTDFSIDEPDLPIQVSTSTEIEHCNTALTVTLDETLPENLPECCSTPVKSSLQDNSPPTSPTPNLDLLADVASTSKRFTPSFASNDENNSSQNISNTMTPNTRQRKCRIVKNIMNTVHAEGVDSMSIDDRVEVVSSVLDKLGLHRNFQIPRKPTKAGRKLTSLETRQKVWQFWHDNSTQSTLSSKPARLPVQDKPKIQTSLQFKDCVLQKSKRGISSLVTTWQTTERSYNELLTIYNLANPTNTVSYGTFFALKPFYVRGVTPADIEMCCCKKHLHARWSIKALLDCAKEQNISLPFSSYTTFFDFLNEDCEKSETTYLKWSCTPDAKTFCETIEQKWVVLKEEILLQEDTDTKVNMQKFVKESTGKVNQKTGKEIVKLVPKHEKVNLSGIIDFIDELLADIIHHRNQLKHFRTVIPMINASFANSLYIDIDFSENLKIPVKWEPQSLHWHHEQVTFHSGIVKFDGEKHYYIHISEDRTHDNVFVDEVILQMIEDAPATINIILINSDNCSNQYKCIQHFAKLQALANKKNITIIRIWSIAGHGKGEVDHVGGLGKVTIRRGIAGGCLIIEVYEIVDYLVSKFSDRTYPHYIFREIAAKFLEDKRTEDRLRTYRTIDGSSRFQVAVFKPGKNTFRAAPHLCICTECMDREYGSCNLFQDYDIVVGDLNQIALRGNVEETTMESESDVVLDFAQVGSIVAIPESNEKSSNTVSFVKIINQCTNESEDDITDGWGQVIKGGQDYFDVRYLSKSSENNKGSTYKVDKKTMFIFKESIVYPFVQADRREGKCEIYFIGYEELCIIVDYVQNMGMCHL